MNNTNNGQDIVVRTERGLTVAGTRITIYALMDYLKAGWPPDLIKDWHNLTDEQIAGVLDYIHANEKEVQKEYEAVVSQAEESKTYWETRNRDRPVTPPESLPPEKAALWAKLQEWKARLEQS